MPLVQICFSAVSWAFLRARCPVCRRLRAVARWSLVVFFFSRPFPRLFTCLLSRGSRGGPAFLLLLFGNLPVPRSCSFPSGGRRLSCACTLASAGCRTVFCLPACDRFRPSFLFAPYPVTLVFFCSLLPTHHPGDKGRVRRGRSSLAAGANEPSCT